MGLGWLGLGITLALLAAAAWLWARGQRAKSGLPAGEIIYSDTGTWFQQKEPLFSAELRLVGRPDYLVREPDGEIVPVEIKSGRAPAEPHEGHILQLAAYCLLVEENFGARPAYGILQYRDRAFAVEYTVELEEDLLDLLADMREDMFEEELDRDHNDWRRCAHCSLRDYCYQRLA
ncbi:MAG: CRISPR-associated protein Cas4 [Chloroflexi bacterium]|nr:CRISPR-associated protein Cas4 [Chloroflexota bacterium]MCI0579422.1 CRISPR-associated protein Cas4 [Chloroflexota bacterium]MCI0643365.1 CRISPR-associated protein Cas4 [Chloroflexota bacterium]MCI0730066.1 CRISPR-associated protein Cas4 [Chloroflexota bacterium]